MVETVPTKRDDAVATRAGIRLRGLRKTFGAVVAVDGIDLDIADGEFFAVLGPSGSGKTTVLRMIAGFEQPTSGLIALGGVDATRIPPFRRDVNTVFQDYALFPHLTVEQNVAYGLRVRKGPGRGRHRRAAGGGEGRAPGGARAPPLRGGVGDGAAAPRWWTQAERALRRAAAAH